MQSLTTPYIFIYVTGKFPSFKLKQEQNSMIASHVYQLLFDNCVVLNHEHNYEMMILMLIEVFLSLTSFIFFFFFFSVLTSAVTLTYCDVLTSQYHVLAYTLITRFR